MPPPVLLSWRERPPRPGAGGHRTGAAARPPPPPLLAQNRSFHWAGGTLQRPESLKGSIGRR